MTSLRFPNEGVGTLEFEGSFSEDRGPTVAAGLVHVSDGLRLGLRLTGPMVWRPAPSRGSTLTVTYDGDESRIEQRTFQSWQGEGRSGDHFMELDFLRDLPADAFHSLSMNATVDGSTFSAVAHLAPGLRRLTLAWSDLDDDVLPVVAALGGLTYLQTFGNRFTDQGVQQLASLVALESLYLEEETLTAAAFTFAADLPELRELGLQDVPITEQERSALRAALPGVHVG
jgi:hypothetical protein